METYFKKEGFTTFYRINCCVCGKEFIAKSSNARYCSLECRPKRKYPHKEKTFKLCGECGKGFLSYGNVTYCSETCRKNHFRKSDKCKEYEGKRSEVKKIKYREAHPVIYSNCEYCGCEYPKKSSRQKFCSKNCCRRATRKWTDSRRRVRNVDDSMKITLLGLIKRDSNKCYICNKDCDLYDYSVLEDGTICPEDMYPTMDHVIPLSKGGEHKWSNIHLAHKICNSRKGDRIV